MRHSAKNHKRSARFQFRSLILSNVHTVSIPFQANNVSDATFKNSTGISSIQIYVTLAEAVLLFPRIWNVTNQGHVQTDQLWNERSLVNVEKNTLERMVSNVISPTSTTIWRSKDDKHLAVEVGLSNWNDADEKDGVRDFGYGTLAKQRSHRFSD